MKKLLPVLLLGSIALTACAAPYPYYYYDDDYRTDRYEQRYDRYDDRYERDYDRNDDYRYRDGKYYDDDYIEHQIYSDRNFEQNRAKAIRMLEQRGYRVHDIDADDYRGRPVLDVEAYKGGREYDIKLSYPDLRIIKERIDY